MNRVVLSAFKGMAMCTFPAEWLEGWDQEVAFSGRGDNAYVRFPHVKGEHEGVVEPAFCVYYAGSVNTYSNAVIARRPQDMNWGKLAYPWERPGVAQHFGGSGGRNRLEMVLLREAHLRRPIEWVTTEIDMRILGQTDERVTAILVANGYAQQGAILSRSEMIARLMEWKENVIQEHIAWYRRDDENIRNTADTNFGITVGRAFKSLL